MSQDDDPSARVELDDRTTPVRIVLAGSVSGFYTDDLYATCLMAIERGTAVELACAELEHLSAAGVQIVLAMRAALVARGLRFEVREVPARLAPLLAMVGLTGGAP